MTPATQTCDSCTVTIKGNGVNEVGPAKLCARCLKRGIIAAVGPQKILDALAQKPPQSPLR